MHGTISKVQINPEKRNAKGEVAKEATIVVTLEIPHDDFGNADAIEELQSYVHNETVIISLDRRQLNIADIPSEEEGDTDDEETNEAQLEITTGTDNE